MKRRKWIGFFAILLVCACLLTIPRAYVVEGEVTDFSQIAPVIKLTEPTYTKAYQSNIPNAFYDSSINFGSQTSDEYASANMFIDLISEDGTHNYAKDQYVYLPYGNSISFYIEAAYMGWYFDGDNPVQTTFEIYNEDENTNIGFTIDTYDAGSADYSQYFSFDSQNTSCTLNDNSIFTAENGNLALDTTYHMPKMTLNGNDRGVTKIIIYCYDQMEYTTFTFELWVVCAAEGDLSFFDGLTINTEYGNSEIKDELELQSFYLESSHEAYFAVPFEFSKNYYFNTATSSIVRSDVKVSVNSNDVYTSGRSVTFYYPGEYDITLDVSFSLDAGTQGDNGKTIEYGSCVIHLLVYKQSNIQYYDASGNLFDSSNPVSVDDLPLELVPFTPNFVHYSTQLSLSFDVTNEDTQATGDLELINGAGNYVANVTINDSAYAAVMDYYTVGDQTGETIVYPVEAEFDDEMSIEVIDLESQYPTPTLSLNTTPLNTQENLLYLSDLYLYTFEVDNYDEIEALGGEIAISIPGITLIQLDNNEFTLDDMFGGTYELVANVYYPRGQVERIGTYPINVTVDMDFGIYDVDAEEIVSYVELYTGVSKDFSVKIYQDSEIFSLPSMLSISHGQMSGIEMGSEPASAEFYLYSNQAGEYSVNIIVLEGEYESYVTSITLNVKVMDAPGLEIGFLDEEESPLEYLSLMNNGDIATVYLAMYDNREPVMLEEPYSIELVEEVIGLSYTPHTENDLLSYFTVEGLTPGNYDLVFNLVRTDPQTSDKEIVSSKALNITVEEYIEFPECYFVDENGDWVSTIDLYQQDYQQLYLYLFDGEDNIQVDDEYGVTYSYSNNDIVTATSSFEGIYYLTTVESGNNIGNTTVTATVTWEDRTFVGTLNVYVSTTDEPTFYFVDENGDQIYDLTIEAGESAEFSIYYQVAQLDEIISEQYEVSVSVNKNDITVLPKMTTTEPIEEIYGSYVVSASSLASGTYVVLCTISSDFINTSMMLNVNVAAPVVEGPTYYFTDENGNTITGLEMAPEETATFYIYYDEEGKIIQVDESSSVRFSISNQNALTVTSHSEAGTTGFLTFEVEAGTINGSFTIIAYVDDADPIMLTVSVIDESSVSSWNYGIYDASDEEVSGLVKLALEQGATYTVKAVGSDGPIELSSDFSILCENYGSLSYISDSENHTITILGDYSPYADTILIKIYYKGEFVNSVVLTCQVGEPEITIPEPDGEFYFAEYEYVAMGEKEFYIPVMYRETGEGAQYAGSDLSVEIINSYLNNGSIYFDSEHNQLVYSPYSSGYEQVTCVFIYKGFYLSKNTFNLRTVITTESIETTFEEGAVVQALLSDEYIMLHVPQKYMDSFYDSSRYAVAMDRNICLVDSYPEQELYVRLNNIGSTDVYLIMQSEGSQVVLKSTIIVAQEEPHIDIDVRREGDAEGAISKLDNLTFSLNRLGFVFSDDLSYEWILDDSIVSTSATYQAKLSEGSHVVKLRLTDNKQNKQFTAERTMRIAAVAGQQHQLAFEENEIYLVMLKNQYELQVLLDGMIANEYTYQWSTDDDTVSLFNSGSSKATILPNHAGTTTVYAFVDVGVGEEKIISAVVTIVVEKVEEIGYRLSQEFPKPGKPFDVIFTVNGRDDCKNADFSCTVLENGEEITPNMSGNSCHFDNPATAKYQITYRLGNLEEVATVKVSNFNFREFLITILPFVMVGLVLAVIAYTFIVRGLNPYRNITKAINQMENTFQKEIASQGANPSTKTALSAFKKLRSQSHKLLNKINYFSDEGFDGLDIAIKSVLTMQAIFDSLVHESASLSEQDCSDALNKTYEQNFKESKELIAQAIDSQLHYQKQVKENNADDKVKKTKTKKERIDYKKELYRNGVLTAPDSDGDDQ